MMTAKRKIISPTDKIENLLYQIAMVKGRLEDSNKAYHRMKDENYRLKHKLRVAECGFKMLEEDYDKLKEKDNNLKREKEKQFQADTYELKEAQERWEIIEKDKRLKRKWNNIWDYFSDGGFEDIILCKVMEMKDAKTKELKIDECDDIIRFTKRYIKKLESENWWLN